MKKILLLFLMSPIITYCQNIKVEEYFEDGKRVIKKNWEEEGSNKSLIEINDGKSSVFVKCINKNGIDVSTSFSIIRDYGKYFKIDISIINNTGNRIDFISDSIEVKMKDKYNMESQSSIINYDEYNKKVVRRQNNNTFWTAISLGVSSGLAGNTNSSSNSYYSGSNGYGFINTRTTTYSPVIASSNNNQNQKILTDLKTEQKRKMNYINDGYLKNHTIFPNNSLNGYLLIPYDKDVTEIDFVMNIEKMMFHFNNSFAQK